MTAKGKITAARIAAGDRILVKHYNAETVADLSVLQYLGKDHALGISDTKTGAGVTVARVLKVEAKLVTGGRRDRRVYDIYTTEGLLAYNAPAQTMTLAPEDAAGIKRAHTEALAEDRERELVAHEALAAELAAQEAEEFTTAEREELAGEFETSGALDEAHQEALTLHSQDGKVDNMSSRAMQEAKALTEATKIREAAAAKKVATTETTPAVPTTEDHTGSTVVRLLEKVWARIRADHSELPEIVITTGSGEGLKWGHFRPESWKVRAAEGAAVSETGPGRRHELFLASEALAKGATQVLQTMLHEAAHTLSRVRGKKDTSRQGRWHNAEFKKAAAEMGLEHKASRADSATGFSGVTLTQATKDRYADLLGELESEIRLTGLLPSWMGGSDEEDERGGEKITGKPQSEGGTKSGPLKAVCWCADPVIIRLSQKTLDLGAVRCDLCKGLFRAA